MVDWTEGRKKEAFTAELNRQAASFVGPAEYKPVLEKMHQTEFWTTRAVEWVIRFLRQLFLSQARRLTPASDVLAERLEQSFLLRVQRHALLRRILLLTNTA